MRNKIESQLQCACITWFQLQYPKEWASRQIHAVPNGGQRNVIVAAQLKREGARSGIWDLQITIPKGEYSGMWIEMKAPKGTLTKEQKEFRDAHPWYLFVVCKTFDEFRNAINAYVS